LNLKKLYFTHQNCSIHLLKAISLREKYIFIYKFSFSFSFSNSSLSLSLSLSLILSGIRLTSLVTKIHLRAVDLLAIEEELSQFQARTYTYTYIYRPRIYTLSSLHRKNRTRTNDQVNKIIISTGKPFIQIYSHFSYRLCRTRRNATSRFKSRCNHQIVTNTIRSVVLPSRRYQTGSSPKEHRRYRRKFYRSDCDGG